MLAGIFLANMSILSNQSAQPKGLKLILLSFIGYCISVSGAVAADYDSFELSMGLVFISLTFLSVSLMLSASICLTRSPLNDSQDLDSLEWTWVRILTDSLQYKMPMSTRDLVLSTIAIIQSSPQNFLFIPKETDHITNRLNSYFSYIKRQEIESAEHILVELTDSLSNRGSAIRSYKNSRQ